MPHDPLPEIVRTVRLDGPGLKVWRTRRDSWNVHRQPIREMIDDAERLPYWSVWALILAGMLVAVWAVT